jgi:hypothetical protein
VFTAIIAYTYTKKRKDHVDIMGEDRCPNMLWNYTHVQGEEEDRTVAGKRIFDV